MKQRIWHGGITTTELGIGAAQFGNLYTETTDSESDDAVEAAWDAGVRCFDTAPHYGLGLSERRLGSALGGLPRDEFVVSTKVGRLLVPNPGGESEQDTDFVVPASTRRVWDFTRDGIRRSLDASLERLRLDRVDVLYLHDPDDYEREALEQALPAMVELRDEGIVRAVGVGMNQSAMPARFIQEIDLDVVMLAGRYTLLEQTALGDLLPAAALRGVSIVAAGVYNSGLLSTDPIPDDAHYNYQKVPQRILQRARQIAAVCAQFDVTISEAAVAFPLQHPSVVNVTIGARTSEHVAAAVARNAAAVPAELWSALVEHQLLDARAVFNR
ncbi:D-threo-aldose 1-dehydrogenase [Microbacterium halimionae]|uniref:D-threo-aldose 1-dehydrogenase n=1 Tax=Microbacterium halimionae TaxID=1526413 RepID=A0A7W3JQK7_9MICO|nr:aldo/keto reductase [Microbacterium halimionae]MBA8817161.1 D-threo-aldose 1-dehydrogenase [Microbacterium halimionae]NII94611.1 D-threo-aldose 1-dehydrogenase [Microbacterium halimionae]